MAEATIDETRRDEAARWFSVLRRGAMTADEHEEFRRWCRDAGNRTAFTSVERTWNRLEAAHGRVVPPPVQSKRRALGWAAAVAACLVAAVAASQFVRTYLETSDSVAETGIGEQRSLTLADGSVVHLGVATRLHYKVDRMSREIQLAYGEAEFLVAKDPTRPFAVQAGEQRIVAIGTRFDVRLRDGVTNVAVREGVVAVTPLSITRSAATVPPAATLHQGQAVSGDAQNVSSVRAVPVERIGEWRDRVLTYERASLREIVRDLNRYFPGRIEIENAAVADERVTLRLEITDRDSTLETITRILPLAVERRATGLVLVRAPSRAR